MPLNSHLQNLEEFREYFHAISSLSGKMPLGRPRRRWEDNIKMYLQEVRCRGVDWIELDKDRDSWKALVNVAMNFSSRLSGKRPLGRPRRRWEDNTKMYLRGVECGVWTESSWVRIEIVGRHL